MMNTEISVWLPLAGFVLQLAVIIIGGVWKLSKLESALISKIEETRREIDDRLDVQIREFGETASALRQKIHEVEIWVRDNFIRRDGFFKVRDEETDAIKEVRDELKDDLRRLEQKIDDKI